MNFKPNLQIKLCGFIQFIFTFFFCAISSNTDFPVPSRDPSGGSVNVITFFLDSLKQSLVFNSPDLNKDIFKLFLHRFRFWLGFAIFSELLLDCLGPCLLWVLNLLEIILFAK